MSAPLPSCNLHTWLMHHSCSTRQPDINSTSITPLANQQMSFLQYFCFISQLIHYNSTSLTPLCSQHISLLHHFLSISLSHNTTASLAPLAPASLLLYQFVTQPSCITPALPASQHITSPHRQLHQLTNTYIAPASLEPASYHLCIANSTS